MATVLSHMYRSSVGLTCIPAVPVPKRARSSEALLVEAPRRQEVHLACEQQGLASLCKRDLSCVRSELSVSVFFGWLHTLHRRLPEQLGTPKTIAEYRPEIEVRSYPAPSFGLALRHQMRFQVSKRDLRSMRFKGFQVLGFRGVSGLRVSEALGFQV